MKGFHRLGVAFALLICAENAAAQDRPAYVGSESCTGCHASEAEAWAGSHHALAWTRPGPDTVLGDFGDAEFSHDGMTARFSEEDGRYHVEVTESDGTTTGYEVHSLAGIAPLQQLLLQIEPGRLQSFDVAWDAERRRWYHLYPDQSLPPDDGLHWTGPYKNWNARCAECHATGYERNFGLRTRRYAPQQAEIGVGCEACHGPGSAHLAWAEAGATEPAPPLYGFTANFGAAEATIQQCAGCHSRREPLQDGNPLPGTPYHDAYRLSLLTPGLYEADGQILDEVYVYGSFLQSRMYASGVSCSNCHDAHAATLKAEGNAVCTQCHSPAGNSDFPSLRRASYDDPSHHFHDPGSDGAQCRNCHMPERVYMGIDARSDHSFRVPRPDLAAITGAPDTCTDCHSDRTPGWAAAEIAARFPDSAHRGAHYGEVLALGRDDPGAAAGDLAALATDPDQPGIVRATALFLMQQSAGPAEAAATAPLLTDADPLVRASATALQRAADPSERIARLMPLLRDPMRSVRLATARQLLDVDPAMLKPGQRAELGAAMADWQGSLMSRMDFPETHLVLGGMALTQRNAAAAQAAFAEAVRLDPQRVEAWTMLVRLADAVEGRPAALRVLDRALARLPVDPGLLQLRATMGR
ncbi:cytochrome c3 family protein [Pukyongiella litopenaei]|uniref:Doubled CXXCH domain-containing protein n=1 Tax=Pukyongiella litopenaei TaxID=2605946 RepID=A0A2S0MU59_9RHOB|nr:cytochrome c3 family protein [Pukyongiella litopenaei]AVO39429.1 hypothetical protein C6Y53_18185 [Pukyongiella litopenaei]